MMTKRRIKERKKHHAVEMAVTAYPPAAACRYLPRADAVCARPVAASLGAKNQIKSSREGMRVINYLHVTEFDTVRVIYTRGRKCDPYIRSCFESCLIVLFRIHISTKATEQSLIARLSSCQSPALPACPRALIQPSLCEPVMPPAQACFDHITFLFHSHMLATVSGRFSLPISNRWLVRVDSACELSNSLFDWLLLSSQVVLQVSFWAAMLNNYAAVQSSPVFRVTTETNRAQVCADYVFCSARNPL